MSLFNTGPHRTLVVSALIALAGAFTISACSSDTNPPDAGTLALALAPTAINVAQGGSGTSAASITRGGAFTGAVTLSASGAPSGVTVTFSPGLIAAGSTSAGISVAVDAAVAAGAKTITISAAGTGVTTATATLTVTVTAASAGSVVLVPNPTALTAAAGGAAATSAIGITRTAPFAGAVDLTVTGQPANVTAILTPTNVPGNSSTLSVTAAAGAVNGTYPLVVRATGAGIADATATIPVTVTGGATAGASFTFNPTSLPVTAGGAAGTSTVTIARTGTFAPSGALNLALSGAPAGLTASVAPSANVTAATATVTAQASAAVAAGTYNLTLTGTGTGIPNAVGTLPVVVSGGTGGGTATVTFCAEDAPVWVAAQDGAGAWTKVTPTSGSTYQFTFNSGKGGIATVDTVASGYDLSVVYASVADFTAFGATVNNGRCESNKVVNGAVSGVGATEAATVDLGGSSAFVVPPQTGFALSNVPAGLQDLVATRIDFSTFGVNWIILRRGLNPLTGAVLPTLTFGTEGFAPVSANVSVTNLGVDTANGASLFTGVRGSAFVFLSTISDYVTGTAAQPYAAIPSPQLNAGELQEVLAFAPQKGNANSERSAGVYFTSVTNRSIALGPNLSTPAVTKLVTGTNARPSVSLASQTQYNRYISANYDQSSIDRAASVFATAGYFGGLPATWTVTVPDLSTVTGWIPAYGLADGTPIDWTVSAQGGAIAFLDPVISDGAASQSATVSSATPLALRSLREGNDAFAMRRRLSEVLGGRNRSPLGH